MSTLFCRCCGAADRNTLLVAALGEGLPAPVVMLQAPGSFFAYEPVLRALKHAQMPLAHLLTMPATAAAGKPYFACHLCFYY